jgi:cysteinyl-tRNA synthetase
MDKVFGLKLEVVTPHRIRREPGAVPSGELYHEGGDLKVPSEVKHLLRQRDLARTAKNYKLADVYRDQIKSRGYSVEDTPNGPQVKKR